MTMQDISIRDIDRLDVARMNHVLNRTQHCLDRFVEILKWFLRFHYSIFEM